MRNLVLIMVYLTLLSLLVVSEAVSRTHTAEISAGGIINQSPVVSKVKEMMGFRKKDVAPPKVDTDPAQEPDYVIGNTFWVEKTAPLPLSRIIRQIAGVEILTPEMRVIKSTGDWPSLGDRIISVRADTSSAKTALSSYALVGGTQLAAAKATAMQGVTATPETLKDAFYKATGQGQKRGFAKFLPASAGISPMKKDTVLLRYQPMRSQPQYFAFVQSLTAAVSEGLISRERHSSILAGLLKKKSIELPNFVREVAKTALYCDPSLKSCSIAAAPGTVQKTYMEYLGEQYRQNPDQGLSDILSVLTNPTLYKAAKGQEWAKVRDTAESVRRLKELSDQDVSAAGAAN